MKVKLIIEGMIFSVIGLIALAEGIRLAIKRDLSVFQDPLGPDGYIIMVGLALIIAGVAYIIVNYKDVDKGKVIESEDKRTSRMVVRIFMSLAVYVALINFIGYPIATLIFFLLVLQIFGFKWFVNAILSVLLSVTFYIIFEYFAKMSFPKGMLF